MQLPGMQLPAAASVIGPQLNQVQRPTAEQLVEIQQQQAQGNRYADLASQLLAKGQRDHSSWGDVAATLVSAWTATKMQKKADESAAEYTKRMLEAQRQQEAWQKQQEAAKAKAEREQKLADEIRQRDGDFSLWQRKKQWEQENAQAAGVDPDVIKLEASARGEYGKSAQGFQDQVINHQKLETALKSNSGAGDYAAVISFVKSLDPTSVVREGEAAMASDVAGLYDKLRMLGQQVKEGERLSPDVKAQYLNLSRQWLASVAEAQKSKQENAIYRSNRYGFDERSVIGNPIDFNPYINPEPVDGSYFGKPNDMPPPQNGQPQGAGPKRGQVVDGYIFLGGDPADQNNWKPQ